MQNIILISITEEELEKLIEKIFLRIINDNSAHFPRDKKLLSAKDAASYLQCSRSHLTKMGQKGTLKTRRLGKRVYFMKEDLENIPHELLPQTR